MAETVTSESLVPTAEHLLEYAYTRSVGPVVGHFLTALHERRIAGLRTRGGKVLVPPLEYDPQSGEPSSQDFVEVGPIGSVTAWTWIAEPRPKQPLSRPFAWALIRLDGADTALLHMVDSDGHSERLHRGLRVRPRWREQTEGMITDIVCFEPVE